MAAVWAAGPEPMMATRVCGSLEDMAVDVVEALEVRLVGEEKEKGRASAVEEEVEGVLCWKVVIVAARGRVKERSLRGRRLKRRKFEENSLLVRRFYGFVVSFEQ